MNRPSPMPFTWTVTTMQITGSSVADKPFGAVLMGGDGTVPGEGPQGAEAFGAPGLVFRPRPPSSETGTDGQIYKIGAEALGARMGDELIPFTWRDLRFNKVYPAPKPGTVALVGYGGAFLSFDDTDALESRATLYVPYAGGTKAMSVIIDPEGESMSLVHGDGMAVILANAMVLIKNASGDAYHQLDADGHTLNGNTKIVGGVDVGGSGGQPFINATLFAAWWTALAAAVTAQGASPLTGATLGSVLSGASAALAATATTLAKGL